MCVPESSSGNPTVKSNFVLPQNYAIIVLAAGWWSSEQSGLLHCAHCMMWNYVHCVNRMTSFFFFSESCARLSYYPASSGNSLPTVQDNTLVSYSSVKMGPMGCPKPSVRNYHSSLHNSPLARSSHLHRSGILKLYGGCFDNTCSVSALVHFTEYFFVVTLCTEMWKKACDMHSWEQGFFASQ